MQNDKKVLVVAGGASGIARTTSFELANRGYRIACIDVNVEAGNKTVEELNAVTEAAFFKCDLSQMDSIKTTVEEIAQHFGRIDAVLCAAAITRHIRVMDITEEDWDRYLTLDLKAQFFMAQACAGHMAKVGGGRIVHFSSMLGTIGDGKHILYGAAKAALHSMTREMAIDFWKDNIQVTAIAPAYVLTPLVARHLDEPGWKEKQLNVQLNSRMLYPEDIAKTLAFLVTCRTPALNGAVIYTDAGVLSFRTKPLRFKAE
jgi:NAD(P)-dependent dehydrogenase (short-subunit alcohol dehydrogenase family)